MPRGDELEKLQLIDDDMDDLGGYGRSSYDEDDEEDGYGMPRDEAAGLLQQLFAHQVQPEFVYRHRWSKDMLTLWDNRCLLHAATGGYQGHARLLHRITIGGRSAATAAAAVH